MKKFFLDSRKFQELLTIAFGLALVLLTFAKLSDVLIPVLFSSLVAYLLQKIVLMLEKCRVPCFWAVAVTFVFFIFLLLLVALWLLPLLWFQLVDLVSQVPGVVESLDDLADKLRNLFPDIFSADLTGQAITYLTSYLVNFGKEIVSLSFYSLLGMATAVIYLILVPLLVFFFLRDGKSILAWLGQFLPQNNELWDEFKAKIVSYIKGKLLEMAIVAVTMIVTFKLFNLSYAVLLGVIVGFSVFVPYVGIAVVTVPVVIVGLIQWGWSEQFYYLMVVYAVLNLLEANCLVPWLFSEAMDLHPLAIILAVLFFGSLFGFWGVFFAIPLATLINIVVNRFFQKESG